MKRFLALLGTLAFAASAQAQNIWSAAGYESNPAVGDSISLGDDRMREDREEVRFRMEVGHHIGTDNSNDNGMHRQGSARCYAQNAAPTALWAAGGGSDYNQDGTSGSAQNLLTETASNQGAPTEDLGVGRCWIDLNGDDNIAGTVEGTDVFVITGSSHITGVPPGAVNLIYNGGFDIVNLLSATVQGDGWTEVSSVASITVVDVAGTNHDGQALTVVANSAGTTDGISQDLVGLKTSTTYYIQADVRDSISTCTLRTINATTDASIASNDGGTWQTLRDTFVTTAASPSATITVQLMGTNNTSDCDWDNVQVYESGNDTIADSQITVFEDTDSSTNSAMNAASSFTIQPDIAAQSVVPSRPGQIILVMAKACWASDTGDTTQLRFRIQETSPGTVTVDQAREGRSVTWGSGCEPLSPKILCGS